MSLLEVCNLKKSFGNLTVLDDVNFTVEKGEIISIIGSSGGGKTTLLRCLNFLCMADEGQIYINGEKIFDSKEKMNEKDFSKNRLHFGLVFQSFNLFPQYTAIQNVTLASKLMHRDTNEKIDEKAFDLLCKVGLEDKKDYYPKQLSGGQKQRVAIARALIMNPDILCFDEPTSSLDPELTGEVLKVIKSLKDRNNTLIVVTHEMEFARSVSDRIIFLNNGIIEEIGSPEQIFNNPKSENTRRFIMGSNELGR